mgnify:CR=1 FL=1|jgi:purine-binding chemotaxis protein CheW
MKFLIIKIGDRNYGLPITLVREILEDINFTPVQKAPEDIVGLMNVRGQIITVLSPGVRLGGSPPTGENQEHRTIVLKRNDDLDEVSFSLGGQQGTSEELYAIIIDGVGTVFDADEEALESIPSNTPPEETSFLTGIARVDDLVLPILKVHKLTEAPGSQLTETA